MKCSHVHVPFLAMIMVVLLGWFKRRWYPSALFTLPVTYMYELTHFLISLVTLGKPVGLSLLPQRSASGCNLGQVTIANTTWFNRKIIGLARLFLLTSTLVVLREGVSIPVSFSPGIFSAYLLTLMVYGCFLSY